MCETPASRATSPITGNGRLLATCSPILRPGFGSLTVTSVRPAATRPASAVDQGERPPPWSTVDIRRRKGQRGTAAGCEHGGMPRRLVTVFAIAALAAVGLAC